MRAEGSHYITQKKIDGDESENDMKASGIRLDKAYTRTNQSGDVVQSNRMKFGYLSKTNA